ncbi:MAG: hypothetical protein GC165_16555 [Armatimonadetes bacterium]|nr:hypothetical protein [Armatimonadota bacterium]
MNVLAPIWELSALDSDLLKRQGGPYYPALQQDLDRLVGIGVARVLDPSHIKDEMGRWRLDGSYKLNTEFSKPIMECLKYFPEEQRLVEFACELALALSSLSDNEFDDAMTEDITYSTPLVTNGNRLDFSRTEFKNLSYLATKEIEQRMSALVTMSPGEKVHSYIRYLHMRLESA